ncbi:MAG: DUF421 domain-containing protein [Thermoproteota archaeon]|nr:DUF421 domain-containing protein [Thermoproteota archaeon]
MEFANNQTSSLTNLFYYAFQFEFDQIVSAIIRTVTITFFILVIIRWLNKKGLGQLNVFELLIVVGLGSAIGDPMIYVEEQEDGIPVPRALVAVIVAVGLFKLFDYLTMKSKRLNKITLGEPTLIVKDGQFTSDGLQKARLNEKEYFAYMRINGIEDVSEVRLSYLEINGQVSFIRKKD